jgi:gliding motility-associated-like protein
VEGNVFQLSVVNNLQELLDAFRLWDPAGNWQLVNNTLQGGVYGKDYGILRMRELKNFVSISIAPDILAIPRGISFDFPAGPNLLIARDTTTGCRDSLFVFVECLSCPEYYSGPEDRLIQNCQDLDEICLDIADANKGNYNITIDGQPYTGVTKPCNTRLAFHYSASIFIQNSQYLLQSWTFGGNTVTGQAFSSIDGLLAQMNQLDPGGHWQLIGNNLVGGKPGVGYGVLRITRGTILVSQQNPFLQSKALGFSIALDTGAHVLNITHLSSGCSRSYQLQVNCPKVLSILQDVNLSFPAGDSLTYCYPALPSGATGTVFTQGTFVQGSIDASACVLLKGNLIGRDTLQVIYCEPVNQLCDTASIFVTVTSSVRQVQYTVIQDQSDTFCLQIPAFRSSRLLYVTGPSAQASATVRTLDNRPGCFRYSNPVPGLDSFYYVVCDEHMICDSTLVFITIRSFTSVRPMAVDDFGSMVGNTTLFIPVLDNDNLMGNPLLDLRILTMGRFGIVTLEFANQSLKYTPGFNTCNVLDSFDYEITTLAGVDTARVYVTVDCNGLTVFNGFSPNNDGVNDVWEINGIEAYPDNLVSIWNRWGNLVFERRNYINTQAWDGKFDKKDLPDGVYFYFIRDSKGAILSSGTIVLHR